MKRFITGMVLVSAFMLFSAGAALAVSSVPDLTGKWKSRSFAHHHELKGFYSQPGPDGEWVVKKQEGRFFYGERTYTPKYISSSKVTEGFSGVISRDGMHVYIADHDGDLLMGDILPDGSIELILMNDGDQNGHSRIGLVEIERVR